MPEKCRVINCTKMSVAKNLCATHYKRMYRNGTLEQTRPNDWGVREKHPAYRSWCGLVRRYKSDADPKWIEDFWDFVKDVPEKPENGKAYRSDKSKPWSKQNFFWKECRATSEDKKEYMREWHRKSRQANPDYYLDVELRKRYMISLKTYQQMKEKQNGVCAICKKPEDVAIRGKLLPLAVDHCHSTNKVRGLLCVFCNRGLGFFKDNVDSLKNAIDYLKKSQQTDIENGFESG